MKSRLLSRLISSSCPHQFSWPRRDENGTYYQWCVNCGSRYRYDWKSMRRTAPIENEPTSGTVVTKNVAKITWKARERRLRHVVPVMYRICGTGEWVPGCSVNVSRSGLLFRGTVEPPLGATVEVMMEMPEEITGEWAAEVTCKATVARVVPVAETSKEPASFQIACSVDDYEFGKKPLHQMDEARSPHHRAAGNF